MAYTIEELSRNYEELLHRVASLEEQVGRLSQQIGYAEVDEDGNVIYE